MTAHVEVTVDDEVPGCWARVNARERDTEDLDTHIQACDIVSGKIRMMATIAMAK